MLRRLGVELDGETLRGRAASGKYEKLRLTLQWILEKRYVSGGMLERVLGHVTCILLVRRPLLSAFATVYKFQQAHYNEPAFLLASCRAELKPFLGAVPLLESDWASSGKVKSWLPTRVTTHMGSSRPSSLQHRLLLGDACRGAIASASASNHLCSGRKHALGDLDPPSARETVEELSGEGEGCVVDDSFKEILDHLAQHILDRPRNGPIPSPSGHPSSGNLLGATRCKKWYCRRCVTLLDNMA